MIKLTDEKALELAEPFGAFEFGNAQGHKRIAFARAIEAEVLRLNGGGGEAVPPEFDVRKIMLDVVPGEDGEGVEVYAKTVSDVERVLSEMGQRLEEYAAAQPQQAAPGAVPEGWQWVPVKATPEMLSHVCDCRKDHQNAADGYSQMLSAAPKPAQHLEGWQPIETAPKDSSSILIYCPRNERKPVLEAWWSIPYEGAPEGHWETPHGPLGRGYIILSKSPTHWMPLPAAPKPQGE